MTFILDTRAVIWALTDPQKLSPAVIQILEHPRNRILVSTITFWEISLKYSLGKLYISNFEPDDFPSACETTGYEIIPISTEAASTYHQFPFQYRKDPFDRMLLWQAMIGGYTIISCDKEIHKYTANGLKVIW